MKFTEKNKICFFQKQLLHWFKKNGRVYPWREAKNSYHKLIAEMMLQRTRVEQVLPVYLQFIKKFKNIESLSNAKITDVEKFVKQLGLFWRSKMIVDMAKHIAVREKSRIPEERENLLQIPGVGDYIADAMIVFAFNGKRTVIDGNVIRLTTRFFDIENKPEIRRNKNFVEFCQKLSEDLDLENVKDFNYALIDFAALICKRVPLCNRCPVSTRCSYYLTGK